MAQIEALAEFLEMYPDHLLYFLARDSEFLFDLAQLLTEKNPKDLNRIFLINISRKNVKDAHLLDYLNYFGINSHNLEKQKILFIDTGFQGTIPVEVRARFPGLEKQIQTQLICSVNDWFPSTRTFLERVGTGAARLHPAHRKIFFGGL